MANELFDGEPRHRPIWYVEAGSEERHSGEILTGRLGGLPTARVFLNGVELIEFKGGIRFPFKREHRDSLERAEDLALQHLSHTLEANGGRLLPDA